MRYPNSILFAVSAAIIGGCSSAPPKPPDVAVDNRTEPRIANPNALPPRPSDVKTFPYKNTASIHPEFLNPSNTTDVGSEPGPAIHDTSNQALPSVSDNTGNKPPANTTTGNKRPTANQRPSVNLTVVEPVPDGASGGSGQTSPVAGLLKQAENRRAAGDLDEAASALERGLRIEPRNPFIWNRLARIRLEQGSFDQAQSMASKSNALAGNRPELIKANQNIIDAANKQIVGGAKQ